MLADEDPCPRSKIGGVSGLFLGVGVLHQDQGALWPAISKWRSPGVGASNLAKFQTNDLP